MPDWPRRYNKYPTEPRFLGPYELEQYVPRTRLVTSIYFPYWVDAGLRVLTYSSLAVIHANRGSVGSNVHRPASTQPLDVCVSRRQQRGIRFLFFSISVWVLLLPLPVLRVEMKGIRPTAKLTSLPSDVITCLRFELHHYRLTYWLYYRLVNCSMGSYLSFALSFFWIDSCQSRRWKRSEPFVFS